MKWKKDYYKLMLTRPFKKRFLRRKVYNEMAEQSVNYKDNLINRIDYALSNIFMGVQPEDYFKYDFYKYRNPFFRNHHVNRTRLIFVRTRLNTQEATDFFDSKAEFDTAYNDYMGRKWCCIDAVSEDEFVQKMASTEGSVFAKPLDSYGGLGARKLPADEATLRNLYKELSEAKEKYIVEEYYSQKGFLHDINPSSLNTIRVITLKSKGVCEPIFAFVRAGGADSIVDNLHAGGVCYTIDMDTGELQKGSSYSEDGLVNHPSTGVKVAGCKVPNWDKVKEFSVKLHSLAPAGAHLVGWDICLSGDELIVIEGNASPGFLGEVHFSDNTWKKIKKALSAL